MGARRTSAFRGFQGLVWAGVWMRSLCAAWVIYPVHLRGVAAGGTERAEVEAALRRRTRQCVLVHSVLGSGLGCNKGRGCVQGQSEPKQGPREAGWRCSGSATAELHHVRRRNGVEHCPGLRDGPRTLGSSAVGREGATSAHRGFVSGRDVVQWRRCQIPAASHGRSAMTGSLGWSSGLLILLVRLLAVLWRCAWG